MSSLWTTIWMTTGFLLCVLIDTKSGRTVGNIDLSMAITKWITSTEGSMVALETTPPPICVGSIMGILWWAMILLSLNLNTIKIYDIM